MFLWWLLQAVPQWVLGVVAGALQGATSGARDLQVHSGAEVRGSAV